MSPISCCALLVSCLHKPHKHHRQVVCLFLGLISVLQVILCMLHQGSLSLSCYFSRRFSRNTKSTPCSRSLKRKSRGRAMMFKHNLRKDAQNSNCTRTIHITRLLGKTLRLLRSIRHLLAHLRTIQRRNQNMRHLQGRPQHKSQSRAMHRHQVRHRRNIQIKHHQATKRQCITTGK